MIHIPKLFSAFVAALLVCGIILLGGCKANSEKAKEAQAGQDEQARQNQDAEKEKQTKELDELINKSYSRYDENSPECASAVEGTIISIENAPTERPSMFNWLVTLGDVKAIKGERYVWFRIHSPSRDLHAMSGPEALTGVRGRFFFSKDGLLLGWRPVPKIGDGQPDASSKTP
jgi:hypothetical protein